MNHVYAAAVFGCNEKVKINGKEIRGKRKKINWGLSRSTTISMHQICLLI